MLRPRNSIDRRHRRGSVASLVALSLPVLIGVSALALDAGLLFVQRRQAQTAAEAVSMAAAYQLYLSSSNTSGAKTAATALATHYGVASPTITIPPTSGTFANKSGYVQVSVTTSSKKLFTRLVGRGQHVGYGHCDVTCRRGPALFYQLGYCARSVKRGQPDGHGRL